MRNFKSSPDDFRTPAWQKKKDVLFEKIDANPVLKPDYKYLTQQMVAFLLPYYDGGEWEAEEYPGIYIPHRYDVAAHAALYGIHVNTLVTKLQHLEEYGLIDRSHRTGNDKQELLYLSAGALLTQIERVISPQERQNTHPKIWDVSITYNTVLEDEVSPLIPFLRRRIGNGAVVVKAGWKPGSPNTMNRER